MRSVTAFVVSELLFLQCQFAQAMQFWSKATGDTDDYKVESCCKGTRGRVGRDFWPDEESALMHDTDVRESVRNSLKKDIEYREGGEGVEWKLDIYTPPGKAPQSGWPTILVLHDGAWQEGDKGGYGPFCLDLAAIGFVTVSVNYRFAPEHPFPAPVEDVMTSIRFLRAKAHEYSIDTNRIGAFGISCGGHMAALAALTQKSDGLEGDGPYQDQSSLLQAVAGISVPSDLAHWKGKNITKNLDSSCCPNFLKGDLETLPDRARKASPITYMGSGMRPPPFFLVHAEKDDTVPYTGQSEQLAKSVCDLGSSSTMVTVPGDFAPGQSHGGALFMQIASSLLPWFEKFFRASLMDNDACFGV